FSPERKKRLDKIRMSTDIIGLGAVYLIGSTVPMSDQWLVSLYTILAWVTVLTLDPSRLPEAATTRIKQRQSYRLGLSFLPLYALIILGVFFTHANRNVPSLSLSIVLGALINAVLYETYFRNIVQVLFRKWGMSSWGAILVQSLLFSFVFLPFHAIYVPIGSFLIGLVNGWMSYKTRSIQWNSLVMVVWLLVIR
ncbi:MAG TPA: CPBP family intramembrane glutamic endopeptidase, partial [Sporolactobacillaceae bacterium]|nr:CPBP family intramembrane glutamic endopeptidase [Sporolactobacillaceae bacterium]